TPQRLLASAIRAAQHNGPVSGTATVRVDLGLPQLPTSDFGPRAGALSLLSDLSGDHTLRVWRSRDGFRVAELLPAAERAVFATKRAVWLWDSTNLTAYRVRAPAAGSPRRSPPGGDATGAQPPPAEPGATRRRPTTPPT